MSFYEDNVADGSHCGSCCQYIGDGDGYPRFCRDCSGGAAQAYQKPIKQKKQAKIAKVKAWLAQHGIKHTIHNNDTHFILHPPTGPLIDCWPTTSKWQQRGGKISTDALELTRLLAPAPAAPARKSKWISVDHSLPPEDTDVLCTDLERTFIASQHNSFFTSDFHDLQYVTHWQPLPLPPTA